ncbi:MAG: Arsenical pump-driving ATPase [Armatimonadetes bacterium]|nr:Arsenical pump-driving ATPase [Armatimonadota bacterium]
MPRIILTAGKGGVGKSTTAAATAAASAALGQRVLVMSIDSAHNLSDLFGVPLATTPTPIEGTLSGLEVDLNVELATNWHHVTDFFRTMTSHDPLVSELVAEECAVLPGMEEVFGLMRLQSVSESGEFDLIVVDTPPTGDLLKFLRLPDVLHWLMQKYHLLDRRKLQRIRPVAEVLNMPLPPDEAVGEMEAWYARVREASATLMDHQRVSVRLVTTPDRVSLAETHRAFNWTSLLGMNVDAVIVNKLLPAGDYPPAFEPWLTRQADVLEQAETSFGDVPILRAELQRDEVLGAPALREFGGTLYGERDPSALWAAGPPLVWTDTDTGAELRVRLPFLKKREFRLLAGREGLTLLVGPQRRVIPLPPAVQRRTMQGARYEDDWLVVSYGS